MSHALTAVVTKPKVPVPNFATSAKCNDREVKVQVHDYYFYRYWIFTLDNNRFHYLLLKHSGKHPKLELNIYFFSSHRTWPDPWILVESPMSILGHSPCMMFPSSSASIVIKLNYIRQKRSREDKQELKLCIEVKRNDTGQQNRNALNSSQYALIVYNNRQCNKECLQCLKNTYSV